MSKISNNHKTVEDQAEDLLKDIISGKASFAMPAPDMLDPPRSAGSAPTAPVLVDKTLPAPTDEPYWKRKKTSKVKTTVRPCIVIDRSDHWHPAAQVDLKGIDASAFTWGYYGQQLPVLVESKDKSGVLHPWYYEDAAGESSNRLYKGAHPDGYKSSFKHRGTALQKIAIGLMIALVLGELFIMFILIGG